MFNEHQTTRFADEIDSDQDGVQLDADQSEPARPFSLQTYDGIRQWRRNTNISYIQQAVSEPLHPSIRSAISAEPLDGSSNPPETRKSSFRRDSLPIDTEKLEPRLPNPDPSRSESHLPFTRRSSLRSDKQTFIPTESSAHPSSIASQRRTRDPQMSMPTSTHALNSSQHSFRKVPNRRSVDAFVANDPFRPIATHNKKHEKEVQNFDEIGLPGTEISETDDQRYIHRPRRHSQSSHRSSSSLGTQARAPSNERTEDIEEAHGQVYPPLMPQYTRSRISLLSNSLLPDQDGWSFAGESDYEDEYTRSRYPPFYTSDAENPESDGDKEPTMFLRHNTQSDAQDPEPQYSTLAESILNLLTSVFRRKSVGPPASISSELGAHSFNFPYGNTPPPPRPARRRHHRTVFSASSSDTADETMATIAFQFLVTTLPSQIYLYMLFRLPSLYFSRVARIFEEAEMTLPELKKMAIETALYVQSRTNLSAFELDEAPPQYDRLKSTWGAFIDSILREWETFNIISALLLSAILTILQIESAARDPITRYTALLSMICALISLLFGCVYIVRFGNMRKTYKAAEWALEAQKTNTIIWWNVWVLLAMPAIWLTWAIISYIACIMSFIWLTTPQSDDPAFVLTGNQVVAIRIAITGVLGVGMLYGMLILNTLSFYGDAMDRAWKSRIEGWIAEKTVEGQRLATTKATRRSSRMGRTGSRSSFDDASTYTIQSGYDSLGSRSQSGSSYRRHSNSHYYGTVRSESPFIPPLSSASTSTSSVLFSNTLQNALPPLEGVFSKPNAPHMINASTSEVLPIGGDEGRRVRFQSQVVVVPASLSSSRTGSSSPGSSGLRSLPSDRGSQNSENPSVEALGSEVDEGQFDDAPSPTMLRG